MSLILSGTDGLSDVDGTAATPAIRGTDANTGIFFGTDIIGFSEGGVEAMRINASGNLQTIGTISVGNATPSTSGAGITFPATQSASSDANTLDDYEEGTWTGTVKGSSGDPSTPVTNTGTYTKVGRQVFARIDFAGINTTGASGEFFVSGLPFSSEQAVGTGNVMTYNIISFPSAGNLCPYVAGTNINIYYMTSAGTWVAAQHSAGAARFLQLSVTYNV